jgi:hypothetical protein
MTLESIHSLGLKMFRTPSSLQSANIANNFFSQSRGWYHYIFFLEVLSSMLPCSTNLFHGNLYHK